MSNSQTLPAVASKISAAMRAVLLSIALLAGSIYALGARSAAIQLSTRPGIAEVAVKPALAAAWVPPPAPPRAAAETLTPRMRAALDYASRRYRVSAEALAPIFAATQLAARDLRLDPLLIIAVIGIESSFNPFAESAAGAQGLMQIIPRYHRDKLPHDAGRLHLFDPVANIEVGTQALYEYIRRNGDVVVALQQFAGDPDDPDQAYAAKVLAEKERLESAALHPRH